MSDSPRYRTFSNVATARHCPTQYSCSHDSNINDDRRTSYNRHYSHDHPYANQSRFTPRVHFARPVVRSISRKPTRMEYFYMNLLEHHVDGCDACEPILYNKLPYDCIKGRLLEKNVSRNIWLGKDGRVYGRDNEWDCEVLVEVSRNYQAVLTLLRQVYPQQDTKRSRR